MDTIEKLLLLLLLAMSSLMLLTSWQYAPEARAFPQVAASITLFFTVIIIVQNWLNINVTGGSSLASRVTKETPSTAETAAADSAKSEADSAVEFGKAEPGEFRISQPTSPWIVPVVGRPVSKRLALAVLLVVYLALLWLTGIFISSVVFVLLYSIITELNTKATLALVAFTVLTLLAFGHWFVTPLFRPGHNIFDIPVVFLI